MRSYITCDSHNMDVTVLLVLTFSSRCLASPVGAGGIAPVLNKAVKDATAALDNTPLEGVQTALNGAVDTIFPGEALPDGTLPDGTLPDGTVPDGTLPGGTVPGGSTVPGGELPGGFSTPKSTDGSITTLKSVVSAPLPTDNGSGPPNTPDVQPTNVVGGHTSPVVLVSKLSLPSDKDIVIDVVDTVSEPIHISDTVIADGIDNVEKFTSLKKCGDMSDILEAEEEKSQKIIVSIVDSLKGEVSCIPDDKVIEVISSSDNVRDVSTNLTMSDNTDSLKDKVCNAYDEAQKVFCGITKPEISEYIPYNLEAVVVDTSQKSSPVKQSQIVEDSLSSNIDGVQDLIPDVKIPEETDKIVFTITSPETSAALTTVLVKSVDNTGVVTDSSASNFESIKDVVPDTSIPSDKVLEVITLPTNSADITTSFVTPVGTSKIVVDSLASNVDGIKDIVLGETDKIIGVVASPTTSDDVTTIILTSVDTTGIKLASIGSNVDSIKDKVLDANILDEIDKVITVITSPTTSRNIVTVLTTPVDTSQIVIDSLSSNTDSIMDIAPDGTDKVIAVNKALATDLVTSVDTTGTATDNLDNKVKSVKDVIPVETDKIISLITTSETSDDITTIFVTPVETTQVIADRLGSSIDSVKDNFPDVSIPDETDNIRFEIGAVGTPVVIPVDTSQILVESVASNIDTDKEKVLDVSIPNDAVLEKVPSDVDNISYQLDALVVNPSQTVLGSLASNVDNIKDVVSDVSKPDKADKVLFVIPSPEVSGAVTSFVLAPVVTSQIVVDSLESNLDSLKDKVLDVSTTDETAEILSAFTAPESVGDISDTLEAAIAKTLQIASDNLSPNDDSLKENVSDASITDKIDEVREVITSPETSGVVATVVATPVDIAQIVLDSLPSNIEGIMDASEINCQRKEIFESAIQTTTEAVQCTNPVEVTIVVHESPPVVTEKLTVFPQEQNILPPATIQQQPTPKTQPSPDVPLTSGDLMVDQAVSSVNTAIDKVAKDAKNLVRKVGKDAKTGINTFSGMADKFMDVTA